MLNLADFSSLVVIIVATIGAAGGANDAGAPWWGCALFAVAGLMIGIGCAVAYSIMAYRCLGRDDCFALVGYYVLPFIAWLVAGVVSVGLALWLCPFFWNGSPGANYSN